MEKKNLVKNLDYDPGQNYSNSRSTQECIYQGFSFSGGFNMLDGTPIEVNYFYKNKSLEVLERDFALKFPGPYQIFIEEQNRRLLDFIETYSKNHEEFK